MALGGQSAEALKAQAELDILDQPPNFSELPAEEVYRFYPGSWKMSIACSRGSGTYVVAIVDVNDRKIHGPKGLGIFDHFVGGTIDDHQMKLQYENEGVEVKIVAPDRMEGIGTGGDAGCEVSLTT